MSLNSGHGTNNHIPRSSAMVPFLTSSNTGPAGDNQDPPSPQQHHQPSAAGALPVTTIGATVPARDPTNQPQFRPQRPSRGKPVSAMDYTDPYGDAGLYSGEVDDDGRPHGKGKMKYDNGIFYEGTWIRGYKDERRGEAPNGAACNGTRNRILGGFTSWKGAATKDRDGGGRGGTFVYGMEWADLRGMVGKYTGHIDTDENPDGEGVMKYECGLVAEGKWTKGRLNDGGAGGMMPAPVAQGVGAHGGMSVAPGGMSVAGGSGATIVNGLGMMSIGGTGGGMGMGMGGYSPYSMYNQSNMIVPAAAPMYYNPAA